MNVRLVLEEGSSTRGMLTCLACKQELGIGTQRRAADHRRRKHGNEVGKLHVYVPPPPELIEEVRQVNRERYHHRQQRLQVGQ